MKNKIQTKHIFLSLFLMTIFIFSTPQITKAETQFYKSDGFVDGFQTPATAQSFCENLNYGGFDNWHLANETELLNLPIGANSTKYYIDALPRTNYCNEEWETPETMGWFNEFQGVRYLYTINSQLEGSCPIMEEDEANVLCARTVATGGGTTGEPDSDLVSGLTAFQNFMGDNRLGLITYITSILAIVFVISILARILAWGIRKIITIFQIKKRMKEDWDYQDYLDDEERYEREYGKN